ncbi:MAG: outer membrane beta-barrel domain-containing protein [Pseudobdellovibrio sp.]
MLRNLIKSILVSLILFATILFFSYESQAEEINVPTDELARDSVYPIFDDNVSVKNRNVKDSGAFDVGIFGGMAITEPVYNASKIGFAFNYHFSEVHSLGIIYAQNSVGLSKDAQGLKDDFGLDFTRAPYPVYSILGDYNYKLYYGKLSVTKNGVINTSIYYSGAAGLIKYIHKSYPTIAVGVGERFYLTNNFALKVDLRLFANEAPSPFKSGALRTGVDPVPSYDSFADKLTFTTNLELGILYLY